MTTLMVLSVTPGEVAPPLFAPSGHGTAHGAARRNGMFIRFVFGLQSGAARAAGEFSPAPVTAGACWTGAAGTAAPPSDAADDSPPTASPPPIVPSPDVVPRSVVPSSPTLPAVVEPSPASTVAPADAS